MALLFIDSFDHYADASQKYQEGGTALVPGRHGMGYNGALRLVPNPMPTSSRCLIGAAIKFASASSQIWLVSDLDWVIQVQTGTTGALRVQLFAGSSVESAPDLLRVNQWHYIETDITIQTTIIGGSTRYQLGPIRAYIDGAQVINHPFLGDSTVYFVTPPSAAFWSRIDFMTSFAGAFDDLYVADGAGPAPWNAPVGDIAIDVIRPNGVGAVTGWTPVGAAANWDAVNDLTPDDDTTCVTAAVAPTSDLYAMENVSTGDRILAAQVLVNARRTAEGFGQVATQLRHAGVTTDLAARALASSYFYRNRDVFVTMPDGSALSDANINALQAGVKRTV